MSQGKYFKLNSPQKKKSISSLTRENGGHHGGEHDEEHGEKDAARVVHDLGGLVADAIVDGAQQEPHSQVRDEPELGQRLRANERVKSKETG